MSDALSLTAAAAAARIRAGELDPAELWHGYRARAAADELQRLHVGRARRRRRRRSTASAPLAGVPVAVKDLFCTEGVPSQAGSKILEGYRPPYTATSVERLDRRRRAAARQDQPGRVRDGLLDGELRLRPDAQPVGPGARARRLARAARAAAVAAGSAPWAIGTDTGGSIRQPAALCGIVGLKPTYGAVSRYGMIAFASSLDQCGPFTRDVTDAALLLGAMAGKDPCDSTSVGLPGPVELPSRTDLRGVRLGVPEELTGEGIEPGVLASFNATLDRARELGATVEPCRLPHAPHALSAYYLIAPAEASSNLARYDGVRYGFRADGVARPAAHVHRDARAGLRRRGQAPDHARHLRALLGLLRRLLRPRAEGAHADQRATSTPPGSASTSSPRRRRRRVAFELGAKTDDPLAMYLNDFCTVPMSLAGHPRRSRSRAG